MAVNLPQPLFVPGGGNQRSVAEQAMLTLLGQAPNLGLQLFDFYQQNQEKKSEEDAGVMSMFLEAQAGNPDALSMFAQQGLGTSPMPSPIEGGEELPGTAPTAQMLDRLSSDARKLLAAVSGDLPQLQQTRLQRAEEVRRQAGEARSAEAHEAQMERTAVELRGAKLNNRVKQWEVDMLPHHESLLKDREALSSFEVRMMPLREKEIQLGIQMKEQQRDLQSMTAGIQHWEALQQTISDRIRAQTSGLMPDDPKARETAMRVTNGLLQGRTAEDFVGLYTNYLSGPRTAEDRSEFLAALAGDTWITMAVNYGLAEDEATQFRQDLETPGANMRTVYRDRMKQMDTAEKVQLNQAMSEKDKELIRQNFVQHRADYRFLFNLWRDAHDMDRVKWPEITDAEEQSHINSTLMRFSPILGPARSSRQSGSNPPSGNDIDLGLLGSFEPKPIFPGGIEQTMFGPQGNRK